jgi:hypothetical protein
MNRRISLFLIFGLLVAARVHGVKTEWVTDHSFGDFVAGEATQIRVTQDGFLKLGPSVNKWVSLQDSTIWDVASDGKDGWYVSAGNEGKIFHVDSGGKSKLFHQTKELNVYALAVDAEGSLFAAGSPDGKIYKISRDGKADVWFEPNQKYVWALQFDKSGRLFAATGEKGILYRISGKSQGEVMFDSDEKHIRTLFLDSKQRLWAGSEPEGIVYRFDDPGKSAGDFRVIYESNFKEVKAFAEDDKGNVYVSIMGNGKASAKFPPPAGGMNDALEGLKDALKLEDPSIMLGISGTPGEGEQKKHREPESGGDASELVKISPSDETEFWSADTDGIYALASLSGGHIWVGTADKAKFYETDSKRRFSFLGQLEAGEVTAMAVSSETVILASSHPAALWKVSQGPAKSGTFISEVIDAEAYCRWGRLVASGGTAGVQWSTRSGNTREPDKSWSGWAGTKEGKIQSRPSRYLQYKLELSSPKTEIDEVRTYYLPFNQRPTMMNVQINPSGIELAKMTRPEMPPMLGALGGSNQKSGKGAAGAAGGDLGSALAGLSGGGMGGAMMPVLKPGWLSASWQAKDPDSDTLSYVVFYRPAGDANWKSLEADLDENFTSWDASAWPDGEYFLKVVTSDAPGNPKGEAKTDEMIGEIFLVDNTAPAIDGREVGDAIKFDAKDASSIIKFAEVSFDGGKWSPVMPDDGILDEKSESFTLATKELKAGSHYVILRVKDQADNEASVTVRFKK